jgi:hypothetical protein
VLSLCGAEEGDVFRITFDLSGRRAQITLGDDEITWEQAESDLPSRDLLDPQGNSKSLQ